MWLYFIVYSNNLIKKKRGEVIMKIAIAGKGKY